VTCYQEQKNAEIHKKILERKRAEITAVDESKGEEGLSIKMINHQRILLFSPYDCFPLIMIFMIGILFVPFYRPSM